LLSPDQTAALESHVAECEACCQALLSVPDDALVSRLRDAVSSSREDIAADATPAVISNRPAHEPTDSPPQLPLELAWHPRYRVEKLLGAGGMGTVYRAYHRAMERPVALKVINPGLMTSPAVVERFTREVKAVARLSHPHIVTAFDAEQEGETHFLITEYVEGTDLGRLVQERGPFPVDRACDYVRQAALGLQHAFDQGMVHRDLKPHNLMLTPDGRVKILDFGLARFASEAADTAAVTDTDLSSAAVTGTGLVLGTVDYIAPEQADDAHQADIRSDIYSLGCTLYHLLAGQPPFPTGTPVQKLIAHREKKPQPLTELRPDLPEELWFVVECMMAKNPADRFQTPAEVAFALEPFTLATDVAPEPQRHAPATDHARTVLLEKTPVLLRRWRLFVSAAAILSFLLAGLLGAVVYRIATDRGELVIETDNHDVEVVVSQSGKVVKIIDTKTGTHVTLIAGEYELALKDGPEDLKLSPAKITLKRGETRLAKIERVPKQPPEKVGLIRCFQAPLSSASILGLAVSPDGIRAVACGEDGFVRQWELASGKQLWAFDCHCPVSGWGTGCVRDVAISPDGRLVLVAVMDCTVRLLDMATGQELRQFKGHRARVLGVSFSPDSRLALSGGGPWDDTQEHDFTVRLWDVASGRLVQSFEGNTNWVSTPVFSPDQRFVLAPCCDTIIRMWDAKTAQEVRRFTGHKGFIRTAAFSSDGRFIVSSSEDSTIRLWDVATGQELLPRLLGHAGIVEAAALSADGRRVFSAGKDGTVRLWDVADRKELLCLQEHGGPVWAVALSRDGKYGLSGGLGGVVRLWRLPDPPPRK
jgi:WD40 repeat protein